MMANNLTTQIYNSRNLMGEAAAKLTAKKIHEILRFKKQINIIFAAAPSQNEFLSSLIEKDIDWSRINGFHMDEYIGLATDAPQNFGNFLREKIFGRVPFKSVNYLSGHVPDIEKECTRYENLLIQYPTDIVCMGIGENGHIAFNDPPVADFKDTKSVKVVKLDEACRQQQVNDGCFSTISQVPTHALTLTIPALMKASYIYCMVPGLLKAQTVFNTLNMPQKEQYPSTILRSHQNAFLFLDDKSSSLLSKTQTKNLAIYTDLD